jgi:hypothetical protein
MLHFQQVSNFATNTNSKIQLCQIPIRFPKTCLPRNAKEFPVHLHTVYYTFVVPAAYRQNETHRAKGNGTELSAVSVTFDTLYFVF